MLSCVKTNYIPRLDWESVGCSCVLSQFVASFLLFSWKYLKFLNFLARILNFLNTFLGILKFLRCIFGFLQNLESKVPNLELLKTLVYLLEHWSRSCLVS